MTTPRRQDLNVLDQTTEPVSDPGRMFAIGDLADELGLTTRAIRFYESRGLLRPRRIGANRAYSRRDRARLILILRGKNLGFSLEDIAQYLALYDADPGQPSQTRLLLDKIDAAMADLQAKRADLDRSLKDLREIRARCRSHLDGEPSCELDGGSANTAPRGTAAKGTLPTPGQPQRTRSKL